MKRATSPTGLGFKLRAVFLPWLLGTAGLVASYSLLHWLLIVGTDTILLNDMLVNLLLPFALGWGLILLRLRPAIKLLLWKSKRGKDHTMGYLLAWLLMSAPFIFAQIYLEEATGTITRLERIGEIDAHPRTRYYSAKHFAIDKTHWRRGVRTSVSSGGSQQWRIRVYYVAPLGDAVDGSVPGRSRVFLGTDYRKEFSNRLSPEEKNAQLDAFVKESDDRFARNDFKWISFFGTVRTSEERKGYDRALQGMAAAPDRAPPLILIPWSGTFESRAGSMFTWFLGTCLGAALGWFALVAGLKVDAEQIEQVPKSRRRGEPGANDDLRAAFAFLVPRRGSFVTPILLHLNVLVWIAMLSQGLGIASTSPGDLLDWGGAAHDRIFEGGELWRLGTSLFVHAGIVHVFNNLVALVLVGLLVESAFGSWWLGTVYLVTGVIAGIVTVVWHPNTVLVGASGSIFGVMGFGLALLLAKRARFAVARPLVLKVAGVYLGLNLLVGLILPGISLVAHLTGLLTGATIGLFASPFIKGNPAPAQIA